MADQSPLSGAESAEFDEIADGLRVQQAEQELAHQVARTRRFIRKRRANGYEPSVSDLVKQMLYQRLSRIKVIQGYAAALWKISEEEERNVERRNPNEAW